MVAVSHLPGPQPPAPRAALGVPTPLKIFLFQVRRPRCLWRSTRPHVPHFGIGAAPGLDTYIHTFFYAKRPLWHAFNPPYGRTIPVFICLETHNRPRWDYPFARADQRT